MKTEYVLGGLALLGVIAIVAYVQKPKRNSDGFFNAGGTSKLKPHRRCYCRTSDGHLYLSELEGCNGSDRCVGHTGVY